MVFRGEHDRRPDQASLARSSIASWPSSNGPYHRKLDASGVSRSSITFPKNFSPVRIPGQATQSKLNLPVPVQHSCARLVYDPVASVSHCLEGGVLHD